MAAVVEADQNAAALQDIHLSEHNYHSTAERPNQLTLDTGSDSG